MSARLVRDDGADLPVSVSHKEAREWMARVREALRGFDAAIRSGDLGALVECAHEVSGCGGELENIADTTAAWSATGAGR